MAVLFQSCDIFNPAEPVPAYIKIESIPVQSTPAYGSSSAKITDIYVLVDNVSIGAYPLPASFPVIASGSHTVLISPGIVVNGISNARGIYPFYHNYSETVNLEPGKITVMNPVTAYRDVTVSWLETFDTGNSLVKTTSSDVDISTFPPGDPEIFEGASSGRVIIDGSNTKFDLQTSGDFLLPYTSAIFLEINYKCNNTFDVGIIADNGTSQDRFASLTINPKETWNKLYVDITQGVITHKNAFDYKIYFSGTRSGANATAYFYFDNLKLLHN